MSEKEGEPLDVSFIAQARSGGGQGTSVLITIPRDVVKLIEIAVGDFLKVSVQKIKK